jgi:KDO2-lipid IV(A) lauroyltransferase
VFVDFFGQLASTTPTLSLLALKTGAPIIPVFSIPGPGGSYRIVYGPEVQVERTGDRDRDVRLLTERCTKIIEEQVRAHPECWLWMHERWKARPKPFEWPGQDPLSLDSGGH